MEISLWAALLIAIILALFVGIAVYFITRKQIEKQLRANPPISEGQIRAMYMSMGRTPSEQQIRQTMYAMKNANNSSKNTKKRK